MDKNGNAAGNLEHLLNISQASEILGVAPVTIRLWISQKKIPYYKVGKSIKFKPSEIEAWVNATRVVPDPDQAENQIASSGVISYMKNRRQPDPEKKDPLRR